jgi:hypothetical protein
MSILDANRVGKIRYALVDKEGNVIETFRSSELASKWKIKLEKMYCKELFKKDIKDVINK